MGKVWAVYTFFSLFSKLYSSILFLLLPLSVICNLCLFVFFLPSPPFCFPLPCPHFNPHLRCKPAFLCSKMFFSQVARFLSLPSAPNPHLLHSQCGLSLSISMSISHALLPLFLLCFSFTFLLSGRTFLSSHTRNSH